MRILIFYILGIIGKAAEADRSGVFKMHQDANGRSLASLHYEWHAPDVSKFKDKTFKGYHRSDGKVGTANYWLFIPTVFCENRNLDVIREALHNELGYAVTDKYKSYTHHLLEAYQKGEDLNAVDLSSASFTNNKRAFLCPLKVIFISFKSFSVISLTAKRLSKPFE